MNKLTNRDKDICGYGGTIGILLSLTCLIQHLLITKSHWITTLMIFMYVFSIVSFSLLAAQKWFAPLLLIINTAIVLTAEIILMKAGVFSLAVVFLFIYAAIITVIAYVEQLPLKLKQKLIALRAERDLWKDKI
jgi:membrane-bound ClpP family serine protease